MQLAVGVRMACGEPVWAGHLPVRAGAIGPGQDLLDRQAAALVPARGGRPTGPRGRCPGIRGTRPPGPIHRAPSLTPEPGISSGGPCAEPSTCSLPVGPGQDLLDGGGRSTGFRTPRYGGYLRREDPLAGRGGPTATPVGIPRVACRTGILVRGDVSWCSLARPPMRVVAPSQDLWDGQPREGLLVSYPRRTASVGPATTLRVRSSPARPGPSAPPLGGCPGIVGPTLFVSASGGRWYSSAQARIWSSIRARVSPVRGRAIRGMVPPSAAGRRPGNPAVASGILGLGFPPALGNRLRPRSPAGVSGLRASGDGRRDGESSWPTLFAISWKSGSGSIECRGRQEMVFKVAGTLRVPAGARPGGAATAPATLKPSHRFRTPPQTPSAPGPGRGTRRR